MDPLNVYQYSKELLTERPSKCTLVSGFYKKSHRLPMLWSENRHNGLVSEKTMAKGAHQYLLEIRVEI